MADFGKKELFIWVLVFGGAYLTFKYLLPEPRTSSSSNNSSNFSGGASSIELKAPAPEDRRPLELPTAAEDDFNNNPMANDAFTVLKAYILAYNANEPQSVLDSMNSEFSYDYGLRVIHRRTDNKLVVQDNNANDILVNQG